MSIDFGYEVLCIASMTVLVVLALVCLVRCIMGPRISDRVMAVNMIGTRPSSWSLCLPST